MKKIVLMMVFFVCIFNVFSQTNKQDSCVYVCNDTLILDSLTVCNLYEYYSNTQPIINDINLLLRKSNTFKNIAIISGAFTVASAAGVIINFYIVHNLYIPEYTKKPISEIVSITCYGVAIAGFATTIAFTCMSKKALKTARIKGAEIQFYANGLNIKF